jgi:hypothetical protein
MSIRNGPVSGDENISNQRLFSRVMFPSDWAIPKHLQGSHGFDFNAHENHAQWIVEEP